MTTAIDILVMILLLIVSVWVIGFGLMGATLAPRAGIRPILGFTAGAMAGPFGITWLWWRGRGETSTGVGPSRDGGTEPTISL